MPEPSDASEQKVFDDVTQYGLHIVHVLPEGDLPEFSYSIGLFKTFSHREILVYGLPSERSHILINQLAKDIRAGKKYLAGQIYEDLLEGYSSTFRAIPPAQYPEHMGIGMWFYDHEEFPSIQFIYPDRSGRWPWETGVSESFRRQQVVLADAPVAPNSGGAA
jgi:hypothetical protein